MRTRPGARPQAEHLSHRLRMVTVSPGGRRRVVDWVLQSSWGSLAVIPSSQPSLQERGPGLPDSTAPTSVGSSPATWAALGKGPPPALGLLSAPLGTVSNGPWGSRELRTPVSASPLPPHGSRLPAELVAALPWQPLHEAASCFS